MAVDDATGKHARRRNWEQVVGPWRRPPSSGVLPRPDPVWRGGLVLGRRRVPALDAEGPVDLGLGEGLVAGGRGNDQVADQLDLVLERVVGQVSTGPRFLGHGSNANGSKAF